MRRTSSRTAVALLAGVIISGLTMGVTYAVTNTASTGVKACVNRAGDLALLSKGKCAHGYKPTTIGKTGPTGKTGPIGKTGSPGTNGVGATSAVIDETYSGFPQYSKTVGTFGGYTITISCNLTGATVSFLGASASNALYVHGSLYVSGYGSGLGFEPGFARGDNEVRTEIQAGNNDEAFAGDDEEVSDQSAHLLLLSGTSTATLDFYQYASYTSLSSSGRCQSDAQLTPSTTQSG